MTRSLLVLATLMVSCSSSPALVATKGQTAAQQEADRQACDAEVGNDQGGALGGNTNAAIGFFFAGAVGVAKAKEAQDRFAKCMEARGYATK